MKQWYDAARAHPSGVLLGVQLAGILVYPFLGDQPVGGPCSACSGSSCSVWPLPRFG